MSSYHFLAACLLAGLSLTSARPQNPAAIDVQLNSGCNETQLYNCVSPIIPFVFSADAQRFIRLEESLDHLDERDYNKICRSDFCKVIPVCESA